jgi:hypothetical protein
MRATTVIALSLSLAACQGGTDPLPPLVAPPSAAPEPAPTSVVSAQPALASADTMELKERIEDLELELAQIKLAMEQMNAAGIGSMDAEHVSYQPNATTMSARTVQAAIDEIWVDLHREELAEEDMGEAGAGLFDPDNGPLGPKLTTEERARREKAYQAQKQGGQPPPQGGPGQGPPLGPDGQPQQQQGGGR